MSYASLVDETADDFRVDTRAYTDPAVLEAEIDRVFGRTWVYVGHTSEVVAPGDFRTATIGRTPVIVVRGDDGAIHVLINECRHRGNAVCRLPRGNAKTFVCPYHGWVYGRDGGVVGVTAPRGYAPGYIERLGGLLRLKCATYRGLIFASLTDDVPPIETHLGDVRKYVDLWANLSPEPEFRTSGPHHYAFQGNWKFQAENAIDGWHARFVHEPAFATDAAFGGIPQSQRSTVGCTRGFERGFAILERPGIIQGMNADQIATYRRLLTERHGADKLDALWHVRHVFLFPNVVLFDNLIRVIQPVSVEETIVTSYPLLLSGASDEINGVRIREVQSRLATTGRVSLDDLEMFASNQTGMRGRKMRHVVFAHGQGQEQRLGGSEVQGEDTSEVPQRSLHREWARLMGLPSRSKRAGSK